MIMFRYVFKIEFERFIMPFIHYFAHIYPESDDSGDLAMFLKSFEHYIMIGRYFYFLFYFLLGVFCVCFF